MVSNVFRFWFSYIDYPTYEGCYSIFTCYVREVFARKESTSSLSGLDCKSIFKNKFFVTCCFTFEDNNVIHVIVWWWNIGNILEMANIYMYSKEICNLIETKELKKQAR